MGTHHETGRTRSRSQNTPSLSTIFEMLSRERRRIVLETLLEHRELGMADLAEIVTCEEEGADFLEVDEQAILETYTELWHVDVPKLQDAGLIEYDQDMDIVTLAPAADEIDGFIF